MTISGNYKDDVYYQNDPWRFIKEQIIPLINGAGGTGIEPSALSTNLRKGYIPLPLTAARVIVSNDYQAETIVSTGGSEKASGGILASLGVIFSINRVNAATDKAARIVAKNNTTGELQWDSIAMPPDLDDTAAVNVNLLTRMAGAADTPVISVGAFFGVGDTNCGGDTSALSDTLAQKTVVLAAGDVPAYPSFLNITLIPGAHTTDAWWLYALWLEYTKKA